MQVKLEEKQTTHALCERELPLQRLLRVSVNLFPAFGFTNSDIPNTRNLFGDT